jgi:hypothetical protein
MSSIGGGNGGGAGAVQVLDWKEAVDTVSDSNIALTAEQTLNGVLTSGSRVGVVGQTDKSENGIYVSAAGAWSRSVDADIDAEVTNGLAFSVGGGNKVGFLYQLTTLDPITVGVTLLTFITIPPVNQFRTHLSPAALAANQNDYDPGDANVYRLTATGATRDITGIDPAGGKTSSGRGRTLTFWNVGSFDIKLMHQNVGSTAANRILISGGSDITIPSNGYSALWYDPDTTRWRTSTSGGAA